MRQGSKPAGPRPGEHLLKERSVHESPTGAERHAGTRCDRLAGRLFLGRADQLGVAHAKRLRQLIERDDRGIAASLLKTADILLAEAGHLRKPLLSQALLLPDLPNVPPDQFAHVHALRSADSLL